MSYFRGGATFTNTGNVPTNVGGISAGSTFNDIPLSEMWNKLLYPYQNPSFSSFSIEGQSTSIEVGSEILAGDKAFNWGTSNSSNVQPDTINIQDLTTGTQLATDISNTGTATLAVESVVNTTTTNHTWRISATNTNSVTLVRNFTVNWLFKVYYGESTLEVLTENDVEGLRVGSLRSNPVGTYSLLEGGYKWICYPVSMGLKTKFVDPSTNFDVAMADAIVVNVTNSLGVAADYYCHRTYNTLGGAVSISVGA